MGEVGLRMWVIREGTEEGRTLSTRRKEGRSRTWVATSVGLEEEEEEVVVEG
jgi:hypothetical protein